MALPTMLLPTHLVVGIPVDDDRDFPEYDCYLFQSKGTVEFVLIQEEMEQLNDVLYAAQNAIRKEILSLKNVLTLKENPYPRDDFEFESMKAGIEDYELPQWQNSLAFLMPALGIVSVHMFLEKSLKSLCAAFVSPVPQPRPGQAKSACYIEHLERGFSFQAPPDAKAYIDRSRRIRNDLAHGDWEKVETALDWLNLPGLLRSVTEIVAAAEAAIDQGRWAADPRKHPNDGNSSSLT